MSENFIETYVIFSLLDTHPELFPWNAIVVITGFIFGLPIVLRFFLTTLLPYLLKPAVSFSRKILDTLRSTNEPVGWFSLSVAIFVALISLFSYINDLERQSLQLRCEARKEFKTDSIYIYAATTCVVKNTGNITSTIDAIEPTFYYSDHIDFARTSEHRSYHRYRSSDFELLSSDFELPQVIQPGETKIFETYVAIPMGWWHHDESENIHRQTIGQGIEEFNACITSEENYNCFEEMTGTEIPNYIYETIDFPAGMGGVQPINGLGVSVKDFDYVAEDEVDMLSNFYPVRPNEEVSILSDRSFEYIRNLNLPWWERTYTYMVGNSGTGTNFKGATFSYVIKIISVIGWVFVFVTMYRFIKS